MPVQATDLSDVLITSLNKMPRLKFTDLMSDYQNTIALKRIFKDKKATIESGPEVEFYIITGTNDSAEHVGLAYTASYDIPNLMLAGKMPWRHTRWGWAIERRMVAMNSGRAKIIDIAQTQRIAALGSAIILFEETLWRAPTLAQFNALHPVGIPYFVVKSNTEFSTGASGNFGFTGSVPSGFTLVANIDPTAQERWKNYAEQYTDVTKDDLIRKMRRAHYYTKFMPLVDDTPVYEVGNDYGIYTNYDVSATMVEILEAQNESLGNDLSSKEGKAVFLRTNITPVRELDKDTTGPVYMLNWSHIGAQGLRDEWMHEQHFKAEANQPTVTTNNTDCTWNLWCNDRRRQAVLATDTTMPA